MLEFQGYKWIRKTLKRQKKQAPYKAHLPYLGTSHIWRTCSRNGRRSWCLFYPFHKLIPGPDFLYFMLLWNSFSKWILSHLSSVNHSIKLNHQPSIPLAGRHISKVFYEQQKKCVPYYPLRLSLLCTKQRAIFSLLYTQTFPFGEQEHRSPATKRRISSEPGAELWGGVAFSSPGWRAAPVLTTSGSTDGRKINRREEALTSCGYKQVLRLHRQQSW